MFERMNKGAAEARRIFLWFSAAILGTCDFFFPVFVVERLLCVGGVYCLAVASYLQTV
jgi:hypothetical protein